MVEQRVVTLVLENAPRVLVFENDAIRLPRYLRQDRSKGFKPNDKSSQSQDLIGTRRRF